MAAALVLCRIFVCHTAVVFSSCVLFMYGILLFALHSCTYIHRNYWSYGAKHLRGSRGHADATGSFPFCVFGYYGHKSPTAAGPCRATFRLVSTSLRIILYTEWSAVETGPDFPIFALLFGAVYSVHVSHS